MCMALAGCSGSGGGTPAAPPPAAPLLAVADFSADTATIDAGQAATLRWDVRGAASVTLSPGAGSVAASGSLAVNPSITTAYTLLALDAAGNSTRAALTVNVNQASGPATAWPLLFVTQVPPHRCGGAPVRLRQPRRRRRRRCRAAAT
jgi:hypothetical protein